MKREYSYDQVTWFTMGKDQVVTDDMFVRVTGGTVTIKEKDGDVRTVEREKRWLYVTKEQLACLRGEHERIGVLRLPADWTLDGTNWFPALTYICRHCRAVFVAR